MKKITFSET